MGLDNMRGSGRPPFLIGGLLVMCVILAFNWWSLSSQNYDLVKQLEHLGEQLKICSDEQDVCIHQRLSAESRIKSLDGEIALLRVHEEQSRVENEELKKRLSDKNDELKSLGKEKQDVQSTTVLCETELESLKKLDISKDGTIASLRLEKERFSTQLEERKQELQKLRLDLSQLESELKAKQAEERGNMKIPMPPASGKNGTAAVPTTKIENGEISVGGNHENARAQDVDKAEIEENNAGERIDEANVESEPEPQLEEAERMEEANEVVVEDTLKKSAQDHKTNRK